MSTSRRIAGEEHAIIAHIFTLMNTRVQYKNITTADLSNNTRYEF